MSGKGWRDRTAEDEKIPSAETELARIREGLATPESRPEPHAVEPTTHHEVKPQVKADVDLTPKPIEPSIDQKPRTEAKDEQKPNEPIHVLAVRDQTNDAKPKLEGKDPLKQRGETPPSKEPLQNLGEHNAQNIVRELRKISLSLLVLVVVLAAILAIEATWFFLEHSQQTTTVVPHPNQPNPSATMRRTAP